MAAPGPEERGHIGTRNLKMVQVMNQLHQLLFKIGVGQFQLEEQAVTKIWMTHFGLERQQACLIIGRP